MSLKCDELSVHKLFKNYSRIDIPKYQRGYNWSKKEVTQFMDDLQNCFESNSNDKKFHHFFGGIVAIDHTDNGKNDDNLEIIDGQQRLTTFVLFVAQIVANVDKYIDDPQSKLTEEQVVRLRKFSNGLKYNYLFYKDEFKVTKGDELKLSPTISDLDCFRDVLDGNLLKKSQYKRNSHKKIIESFKTLDSFVKGKIVNFKKFSVVLANLEKVRKVLEDNCRLIFITTSDRNYAYQYFQVLNDRGMKLSVGNLLKADTLRLLEENGFHKRTSDVAELWDIILEDKPEEADKNLQAVYMARVGKRPHKLELPRQIMEEVIGIDQLKVNSKYGHRLKEKVRSIVKDVATVRRLKKALWVPDDNSSNSWKKERLNTLILYLRNRLVLPFLLALSKCQSDQFYETVTILERYVCRYINIQKLSASSLEEVLLEHAPKFYQRKYYKGAFLEDLKQLLVSKTSENQFRADLSELRFHKGISRENLLKVFFSILEYHWSYTGEDLEPKYEVNGHTANLSDICVEHIFPQESSKLWTDDDLEGVVHDLGNLTVLRTKERIVGIDRPFGEKRDMFRRSSFQLSRVIAKEKIWTSKELEKRQLELIDKAVQIFIPIK